MDWFGKHDDANKDSQSAPVQDLPIQPTSTTPSLNNSFSSPAFAASPVTTSASAAPSPVTLPGNAHIHEEMEIIKSLPASVPAELIVAIIDHRSEYLQAAKDNKVTELLDNIKKFNPLIKSFYEYKSSDQPDSPSQTSTPANPQPAPDPTSPPATPDQPAAPTMSEPEHPYES